MNAPLIAADSITLVPSEEVLAARSEARALLFINGELSLLDAVDPLQAYAEQSALVDIIGQDRVQEIIAEPFAYWRAIADDECDQPDDFDFADGVADIVRRIELADPRDRWIHTGEPPPPLAPEPPWPPHRTYCTPQSVIDAFWFLVSLNDPGRLKAWMRDHPKDAPTLLKLLENK